MHAAITSAATSPLLALNPFLAIDLLEHRECIAQREDRATRLRASRPARTWMWLAHRRTIGHRVIMIRKLWLGAALVTGMMLVFLGGLPRCSDTSYFPGDASVDAE